MTEKKAPLPIPPKPPAAGDAVRRALSVAARPIPNKDGTPYRPSFRRRLSHLYNRHVYWTLGARHIHHLVWRLFHRREWKRMTSPWPDFVGCYFHAFHHHGDKMYPGPFLQGRIVGRVNNDLCLVELFDWITGESDGYCQTCPVAPMEEDDWRFYKTSHDMCAAYDGMCAGYDGYSYQRCKCYSG